MFPDPAATAVHVAQRAQQLMRAKGRARDVLVLGATGAPDSLDLQGSMVSDLLKELRALEIHVDLCEPLVILSGAWLADIVDQDVIEARIYDGIIVTVAHAIFRSPRFTDALGQHMLEGGILLDVPGMYKDHALLDRAAGGTYWHLG